MNKVRIDGVVYLPATETYDTFVVKFFKWVEEQGCTFGGFTDTMDGEEIDNP